MALGLQASWPDLTWQEEEQQLTRPYQVCKFETQLSKGMLRLSGRGITRFPKGVAGEKASCNRCLGGREAGGGGLGAAAASGAAGPLLQGAAVVPQLCASQLFTLLLFNFL